VGISLARASNETRVGKTVKKTQIFDENRVLETTENRHIAAMEN